ncbi:hypothetical protein CFI00_09990 [Nocardioides sp. S5]|nr:hypothetical protein CFI00_09990 [Nocardioides sp. S5]
MACFTIVLTDGKGVTVTDQTVGLVSAASLGAWLLKANPTIYPIAEWIQDRPDEPVTSWSVQRNYRSAMMEAGQPVYLWISGDGRDIEPGVWGYGVVTGPCEVGTADSRWLDRDAASGAGYYAMTEINFLASPVSRSALNSDPRFADLEVLKVPAGSNPSFLTIDQARALRELAQAADRGTCPRCRNGEILHVVFGMLPPGSLDGEPPWVTEGGCVIMGLPTNRHCPACGLDWLATSGGRPQARTLHELRTLLGCDSTAGLEDLLWDHCDVDVHVEDVPDDHDEVGALSLRIGTRGVTLEFPFSVTEFIVTVDELLAEVLDDWDEELRG